MSKTRKYLGIVMAIALLLNMAAVAAFAADDASKTNTWTLSSTAFATEPTVNGSFTVDVQLQANYYLGPVQFALQYNSASFTATDVTVASGYPYDAVANYNYDSANGILRVVIIPDTAGLTTLEAETLATAATIATVTFTYHKGGTIEVFNDYKTDANIDGTLCAFRSTQDDLLNCGPGDLLYGQVPTITAGDHEVGSAAVAPELAVISGTGGVIDAARGYIYGVEMTELGESIENVFEVTGDGYISIDQSTYAGTGATVAVYDNNDNLVAEYTFILFGDVNGDSYIDTTDSGIMEAHDAWVERIDDSSPFFFAGDLDLSVEIDTTDAGIVELHDSWAARISQADMAAMF